MPATAGVTAEEYAATKPVPATMMALLSLSGLEGLDAPGGSAVLVPEPQPHGGFVTGGGGRGLIFGTVYFDEPEGACAVPAGCNVATSHAGRGGRDRDDLGAGRHP